jgi:chromosome segregation ATPase
MGKPLQFVLIAGLVLFAGAAAFLFQRVQKTSADYATLQSDEQAMRNRYGQAINEIAMIQDSLNAIVLGDEGARALATQLDAEQRLSQTKGDEALQRIAVLKAGIERTKDRIQELDARLKQSGVKVAGLQKMIANLKQNVAEREQMVTQLTGQVNELQTQVTGLTADVQSKQETIEVQTAAIEDKRRELGTVYYTIGSKKDLTDAGLVIAKGGVLGMGKTLEASGKVDGQYFTAIDTDEQTVIRIPSAKVQVVSDQPPSSYELQTVGETTELRILNPDRFRTVKHVVILTT